MIAADQVMSDGMFITDIRMLMQDTRNALTKYVPPTRAGTSRGCHTVPRLLRDSESFA